MIEKSGGKGFNYSGLVCNFCLRVNIRQMDGHGFDYWGICIYIYIYIYIYVP